MTLYIMQYTGPATESIEIGRADMMVIRDKQGNAYDYTSANGNIKDDKLFFHGWKEPVKTVPTPLSPPTIPESQTIQELRLTVACLTHMLGGAVSISPWEYSDARDRQLVISALKDPWMLQIKVEDKQ